LPDPVPDDVKKDRWERFMAKQQAISAARLQRKIGTQIEILIDEVVEEGLVARSWADAPEIDGRVFIDREYLEGLDDLQPGDSLVVEVIDADEYDLWAAPVNFA
jgi:ribosomal protein S12 methylthiotransferase